MQDLHFMMASGCSSWLMMKKTSAFHIAHLRYARAHMCMSQRVSYFVQRLRHRSVLPPLESMGGSSQYEMHQSASFDCEMRNKEDILEEIFSVAQASQDLIYHSEAGNMFAYAGNVSHGDPMLCSMNSWQDPMAKSIEIRDAGDFKSERMVKYSELVVLPADRHHELDDWEERNDNAGETFSSYYVQQEIQGKVGDQIGNSYMDATNVNTFPLGSVTDGSNKDFMLDFNNADDTDVSGDPSFEVLEKVEVNRGLLVATQGFAETRFLQVLPSTTVQVHLRLQPRMGHDMNKTRTKYPLSLSSLMCRFRDSFRPTTKEETRSQKDAGRGRRGACFSTIICTIWESISHRQFDN
ncbi:NAC domain-containing protein [Drosera capensis]